PEGRGAARGSRSVGLTGQFGVFLLMPRIQHRDTGNTQKMIGTRRARAMTLCILRACVLNLAPVATLLLVGSLATSATAATAPKVRIATLADLPIQEMRPYDETANADAAVNAAFARAKKSHKRVLIDLGGNWCGDCIILDNVMQLPEVKRFVETHYET